MWLDLCLLRWNPVWYPVILPAVIYHSTLLSFPPSEECVHLCILNTDLGLKNMIRKCRHKEFVPEATLVGIVSALPTHCRRQKHTVGGSVYVSCLLSTNSHVFCLNCWHTQSHLNIIPQGNRYCHSPILKDEETAADRNMFHVITLINAKASASFKYYNKILF